MLAPGPGSFALLSEQTCIAGHTEPRVPLPPWHAVCLTILDSSWTASQLLEGSSQIHSTFQHVRLYDVRLVAWSP
jgi:hypothetical protein